MSFKRFQDRQTRISRREERNMFRRQLLPIAWGLALVGFGGLLISGLFYTSGGAWARQIAGISFLMVLLPVGLTTYAWLRGHGSDDLEEP